MIFPSRYSDITALTIEEEGPPLKGDLNSETHFFLTGFTGYRAQKMAVCATAHHAASLSDETRTLYVHLQLDAARIMC